MADPSALACHDLTHGSTGSTTFPKLHHHGPQGERVGHSRFGSCIWCGRGDDLHGEPTLVRAIRAEMESSEPTPVRADGTPMESTAEAYARLTAGLADLHPHVVTLRDGSTIEQFADGSRVWTAKDGTWRSGPDFGPWERDEPVFPAQRCPSCGAEHPGQPCAAYDGDLFGGAL